VYLRQTKRKNKDGTVAHYLQLAHNVRDPDTGVVKAKLLHSFGRAEHLERESLERLIASISRYLDQDPPLATARAGGGPVEAVDARHVGGAWVLEQLWRRLGIDKSVRKVAAGRKFDAQAMERLLFALVACRALAPSSKLEATRWIADDVHIDRLEQPTHTDCYRAMDFLLDALDELQEQVFFTAADLLSLPVDVIFFDTTSTYFELEYEDGELDDTDDEDEGFRRRGHSKDSRPDLPQVVIGMAVTMSGLPVRLWVWPGNTTDSTVLDEVKTDLAGWQLNRTVWVVDAGFTSRDNRKVLTRGGSGFIIAEKLRGQDAEVVEAKSRQGRFRKVDEDLEVKDIRLGDGAAQQRFVMVRNLAQAKREAHTRQRMVELLEARIAGSDDLDPDARAELRGRIREKPGLWRYLRITKSGLLRLDRAKIAAHARLDGKTLLRTSDLTLDAEDIARGYKALQDVERGFRDLKQLELRPVYHRKRDRIVAHVQLCWLSLLLIRTAEIATGETWRNLSHELDRIRLVTLATEAGTVSQRTRLDEKHRSILRALDLPEPPRYYDFSPLHG
jgi:transposase